MADILTSHSYLASSQTLAADTATLSYEDRFLRRKVVPLGSGRQLLINLAQTTSLDHGGRLVTTDGLEIEVRAAPEALYKVTGPDLTRLAWHIGNRHTPCQIMGDHILIQRDPVIAHMLEHLGATLEEVTAPFTPEGGAYGHGRTHRHEHGKTAHAH
ncbi:MAG: urease accessory protein UreE [Pseudomonadota bacterium]